MTHYAWTYFVGTREEAQEIANEWNEITNTKEFRVCNSHDGGHYIEGYVNEHVLEETNIENEFVIEER